MVVSVCAALDLVRMQICTSLGWLTHAYLQPVRAHQLGVAGHIVGHTVCLLAQL